MRVTRRPVSTLVVACLALLATLALGGMAQAAGDESSNVAPSRPLCKQAERAAVDGLQLRSVGGVCLLARPGTAALASKRGGSRVVHTGKIVDTDDTYGDGVFHVASGRAFCKHGERVVTGGLQIVNVNGLFGGPARTGGGESAPYLKKPGGWSVAFASDMGGGARQDFRVVVICEK